MCNANCLPSWRTAARETLNLKDLNPASWGARLIMGLVRTPRHPFGMVAGWKEMVLVAVACNRDFVCASRWSVEDGVAGETVGVFWG